MNIEVGEFLTARKFAAAMNVLLLAIIGF